MAENFVDIVGYQLEKIHTGMIAWLLDSERSPLPLAEQTEVMAKLAPDVLQKFNWDTFRLKADIKEQTAARWDRWRDIRTCLVELCESCAGHRTPNRTGKSVTAYRWKFNFCREKPSVIARKTNNILSHIHESLSGIQ